jgi:transcription elongation GreA/GreB family factor
MRDFTFLRKIDSHVVFHARPRSFANSFFTYFEFSNSSNRFRPLTMSLHLILKSTLFSLLIEKLETDLLQTKQAIEASKEARNSDTKSSVGDKYETGRAMAQIEIDKLETQLNKTKALKQELEKVDVNKKQDKVAFGSIVSTNQGRYFIAIAMGRIHHEQNEYYVISLASPIGSVMKDKVEGDVFDFQGKQITIQEII